MVAAGQGAADPPPATLATLEATVEWVPESSALRVRYRVAGEVPGQRLVVFDRGDTHAVLVKRQRGGDIAQPQVREDGRDMTLTHQGRPLPEPAPTVPPIPLVTQLVPGAVHEGGFELRMSPAARPGRVRYCVGVAAIDAPLPDHAAFDGVWQSTPDLVARQQLLCTPWFDVGAADAGR